MRTNASGVYGPWIPLRLTWRQNVEGASFLYGTITIFERIRGYDVETHGMPFSSVVIVQKVTICGEDLLPANANEVQFRWMNTAGNAGRFDMWAIFNVTADLVTRNGDTFRMFGTNNSE